MGAGAGWFGTGIGYKTKSGIGVSSQIYVKDNLCVYYQYGNTKATADDDIRYTLTEEDYGMSCLGCLLVKLPVASGVDARVPAQREPVNRVRAGMQQH